MDLAGLLAEKLVNDSVLTGMLAGFNGGAAIFELQAPPAADPGWTGAQYPRIAYAVERSEEPQRRTGGTVIFNIWGLSRLTVHPRVIAARLKELVDGGIFHPDGEPAAALRWQSAVSAGLEDYEGEGNLILALTVQFDLIFFPSQVTTGPDPLARLKQWTEEKFFTAQVDPAAWAPEDLSPAIYWRTEEIESVEQYATASWVEARIAALIIAPTQAGRERWVKRITEQLALVKELELADGSPLFLEKVRAANRSDYLLSGQIILTVRYGVRPEEGICEKLNNAHLGVER